MQHTEKLVFGAYAVDSAAIAKDAGADARPLAAKLLVAPSGTLSLAESNKPNPLSPAITVHFAHVDTATTAAPLSIKKLASRPVVHWAKSEGALVASVFAEYSEKLSRNMGLLRVDLLQSSVLSALSAAGQASSSNTSGNVLLLVALKSADHAVSAAAAVARCFNPYSRKTGDDAVPSRSIFVDFVILDQKDSCKPLNYAELQSVANAVRHCQYLTDSPCEEMHSDAFVQQAENAVARLIKANPELKSALSVTIIRGTEELEKKGFGGLSAVGRAALHGPALCVLSRAPIAPHNRSSDQQKTLAFVGKGIMFDTGGLSLKQTAYMTGMKHDMGGAAAVLNAFEAAVAQKLAPDTHLHAVLCVAENAIGSRAYRNDDILRMYSGKTVEINNTDAEGRLVLADGVAYAAKHLLPTSDSKKSADSNATANAITNAISDAAAAVAVTSLPKSMIVTVATLTGAQMVATGLHHAGVLANHAGIEAAAVKAGRVSGDLVFPLLYAPEILRSQFESPVADMKNSVKDRTNAPSSAAGHFIESHLGDDYAHGYLHVDIAGPSGCKERATGFGVALLYEIARSF